MGRTLGSALGVFALMLVGTAPALPQDRAEESETEREEGRKPEASTEEWLRDIRRDSTARSPWAQSLDGKRVAAGNSEGAIEVWTVPNAEPDFVLDGHPEVLIDDLEFHPWGKLLTSIGGDGRVRFWDLATQTPTATWGDSSTTEDNRFRGVDYSPDGERSVFLRRWDAVIRNERSGGWLDAKWHTKASRVVFLEDSDRVIESSQSGVRLRDLGLPPRALSGGETELAEPVWHLRGTRPYDFDPLLAREAELGAALWFSIALNDTSNSVVVLATAVPLSPWKNRVTCWDVDSGKLQWELDPIDEYVKLLPARDAEYFAILVGDELRLLAPSSGRVAKRRTYESPERRPSLLAADGSIGFTATADGHLVVLPAISSNVPKPAAEPEPADDAEATEGDASDGSR